MGTDTHHARAERMSAADTAYNAIVELILNQRLRPGERTSVNLLTQRLGLGRTPVKEAISRLETEGVLSVAERSGTTLNAIDEDAAVHLFALRRVLEDFAAESAVVLVTPDRLGRLRRLLQQMREASLDQVGGKSPAKFVRANVAFHAEIVAAAGNPFLDRLYAQLQLQLQIVTYLIRQGFSRDAAELRQREHEAIVEALAARNAGRLKQLLRTHTATTEATVLERRLFRADDASRSLSAER